MLVRELAAHGWATPTSLRLLWLAAEVGDDGLAAICERELPTR